MECGGESDDKPSREEVLAHADRIGLAAWKAADWFDEMEGCGWLDYLKRPVLNWKAVLNRVRTKWEADGRPASPPKRPTKPSEEDGVSKMNKFTKEYYKNGF